MQQLRLKLPKPHKHQQAILDSKAKVKVLKCGRQSGKSTVSLIAAVKTMLAGGKVLYICNKYSLSGEFYEILLKILPSDLIEKKNGTSLSIQLKGLGDIEFFSGGVTDGIRGRTNVRLVICDEFAFWRTPENSLYNDIMPVLAKADGDIIVLSSPLGRNFFYELWVKASHDDTGEMEGFYFTILDNPYIPQSFIERTQKSVPTSTWQQEYLALETAAEDCIVDGDVIERNTIDELVSGEPVVIGIDLAKKHDYTSITGLNAKGEMCMHYRFNKKDWTDTMQFITTLPAKVLKIIDANSIGDVVIDGIRKLGVQNLIPFLFNGKSKPELIQELILALERDELKFNKQTALELSNYRFSYTASGHIQYEGKPFDDSVISLALANKYRKNVAVDNNFANRFSFF